MSIPTRVRSGTSSVVNRAKNEHTLLDRDFSPASSASATARTFSMLRSAVGDDLEAIQPLCCNYQEIPKTNSKNKKLKIIESRKEFLPKKVLASCPNESHDCHTPAKSQSSFTIDHAKSKNELPLCGMQSPAGLLPLHREDMSAAGPALPPPPHSALSCPTALPTITASSSIAR